MHVHHTEFKCSVCTSKCSLPLSLFWFINVCLPFSYIDLDPIGDWMVTTPNICLLILQRQRGMYKEWVYENVDSEVARIICETVDSEVAKFYFNFVALVMIL